MIFPPLFLRLCVSILQSIKAWKFDRDRKMKQAFLRACGAACNMITCITVLLYHSLSDCRELRNRLLICSLKYLLISITPPP